MSQRAMHLARELLAELQREPERHHCCICRQVVAEDGCWVREGGPLSTRQFWFCQAHWDELVKPGVTWHNGNLVFNVIYARSEPR